MNSNLFHNIGNIAMIVIAGVTAVLTAMGCTTLPSGELECSNITFLSPTVATLIITAIGIVKMLVNIVRDGVSGLAKRQPPVQ